MFRRFKVHPVYTVWGLQAEPNLPAHSATSWTFERRFRLVCVLLKPAYHYSTGLRDYQSVDDEAEAILAGLDLEDGGRLSPFTNLVRLRKSRIAYPSTRPLGCPTLQSQYPIRMGDENPSQLQSVNDGQDCEHGGCQDQYWRRVVG